MAVLKKRFHNEKLNRRARRARRARAKIRVREIPRLCVRRTLNHVYAQLIAPCGSKVLASASTLDKAIRGDIKHGGNCASAVIVGRELAKRALAADVKKVAFDRSGFRYHGCIKALADAAREGGLEF